MGSPVPSRVIRREGQARDEIIPERELIHNLVEAEKSVGPSGLDAPEAIKEEIDESFVQLSVPILQRW